MQNHGYIWLLVILLIINLIIAVLYLIKNIYQHPRIQKRINFVFFLVYPIVGEAFMLLATLVGWIIDVLKNKGLNMQELSFSKDRMKLLQDVDIIKAMNSVPIEEALIVSQKNDKREAFIDVLKSDDYQDMMGKIKNAVENNDREVAHYAATFVSDSLARFKVVESELREKLEKKANMEALTNYTDFMRDNMNPEIFGAFELGVFTELFQKACELTFEISPRELKATTVTKLVEILEYVGDNEKSELWISRAKLIFQGSLEGFKLCARYYYKHHNYEALSEIVNEIKVLSVPLDSESLEWIRLLKI